MVGQNLENFVDAYNISVTKSKTNIPEYFLFASSGRTVTRKYFTGKTVYIDVWASWCGPCIAAMPAWNNLVDQNFDSQNIAFVTVSLDGNKEKWMNAINLLHPKGLTLISKGGDFLSEFAKIFDIESIPKNILLDSNGLVIDRNALPPALINLAKYR